MYDDYFRRKTSANNSNAKDSENTGKGALTHFAYITVIDVEASFTEIQSNQVQSTSCRKI